MCKTKKCKSKNSKCTCEENIKPDIPLKTNTAIMEINIKASYAVDLDEMGRSEFHKTDNLEEISQIDIYNIMRNQIDLGDFLKHFCHDISLKIEPVGTQKIGNS